MRGKFWYGDIPLNICNVEIFPENTLTFKPGDFFVDKNKISLSLQDKVSVAINSSCKMELWISNRTPS
jgi:hypothetical protein